MSQWSERVVPAAVRWADWRRGNPEPLAKQEQALLEVIGTHTDECLKASGEDVREVVPAAEWRRRFGDPFRDRGKEADDGEA